MNPTHSAPCSEPDQQTEPAIVERVRVRASRFLVQDEGAALIEYGMLALLIAVLCIVALKSIGSKISNGFNSVNIALP